MNGLLREFIWDNRYRLKFACEVSGNFNSEVREWMAESGLEATPEQLSNLNKLILTTIEEMEKDDAV